MQCLACFRKFFPHATTDFHFRDHEDSHVIPTRNSGVVTSAFGKSRGYFIISVSNFILHLCIGRLTNNDLRMAKYITWMKQHLRQ